MKTSLGQIILKDQKISKIQLDRALHQQSKCKAQSQLKPIGEILVDSGVVSRPYLLSALERQSILYEIEYFPLDLHPSIHSKVKRVIDVCVSLIGICTLVVVTPLIAIAILLESRGSIFTTYYRFGLRGRQYRVLKFRTMASEVQTTQQDFAQRQWYRPYDDPDLYRMPQNLRITRVGKFLRRTYLDELPQFINVFKGEMSLVGIRPSALDEVTIYEKRDWRHHAIKPGMIGLWQISPKKNSPDVHAILALDRVYANKWNHKLDLALIFNAFTNITFNYKLIGRNFSKIFQEKKSKVSLLNIEIDNLSKNQLLESLNYGVVFTPNVDHIMKLQHDSSFYDAYKNADYKVCDSQILMYASRFLGQPIQEKISGSDFFPYFCQFHRDNSAIRIFLLGGRPGVADLARENINHSLGREIIIGSHSPSFGFIEQPEECQEIVHLINQFQPTVLAIGVGAPTQEKWIFHYRDQLTSVKIFLAVGATLDFEAGNKSRSPKWMSHFGLEWSYRLILEPKRLWKRYLIDDIPFIWLLLKQKFGLYSPPFMMNRLDKGDQDLHLKGKQTS